MHSVGQSPRIQQCRDPKMKSKVTICKRLHKIMYRNFLISTLFCGNSLSSFQLLQQMDWILHIPLYKQDKAPFSHPVGQRILDLKATISLCIGNLLQVLGLVQTYRYFKETIHLERKEGMISVSDWSSRFWFFFRFCCFSNE